MEQVIEFIKAHAPCIKIIYVIIAMVFVWLYGRCAIYIFISPEEISVQRDRSGFWEFHQFWVNTLGQSVGWVLGYYICKKVITKGLETFSIQDYIALIIAFLGITGYIPTVLTKWQPKT
jgi:hypothetical protein